MNSSQAFKKLAHLKQTFLANWSLGITGVLYEVLIVYWRGLVTFSVDVEEGRQVKQEEYVPE